LEIDSHRNPNHPLKGSRIKAEPIREIEQINAIRHYNHSHPRNAALFEMGISTFIRPSDILDLTYENVIDLDRAGMLEFKKKRTGKPVQICLPQACVKAIERLIESLKKKGPLGPVDYLFKGRKGQLTTSSLNNLIKIWCTDTGIEGNFGVLTLRKTYGYHQLKSGEMTIHQVMKQFGHLTATQSLKYFCIHPDELPGGTPSQATYIRSDMDKLQELEQRIRKLESGIIPIEPEKTAEAAESLMEAIFNHANDEIMYIDTNGIILQVNERALDFSGYTREEIAGRHISELGFADQQTSQDVLKMLEESLQGKQFPSVMRFKALRKDNSVIWVETTHRRIEKNGVIEGWVVIIRDVTELKRMECEAQENAGMARALLNASSDAIMLIDIQGTILDLNTSYAGKLGRSVDDLKGLKIVEVIGVFEPELENSIAYVIKTGKVIRSEKLYSGLEKSELWMKNVIYPITGLDGIVTRVALFSHDITELKNAEKELRKSRDQLEELVKERTANLEETNTALKVLLEKREMDKQELEEKILYNTMELILPTLEKLKSGNKNDMENARLEIIESNLRDIVSPFSHRLSSRFYKLTPTELEIANLIKFGKTTKDIGDMLNLSDNTIQFHRANIRKKLGINNQKTNLRSHLQYVEK